MNYLSPERRYMSDPSAPQQPASMQPITVIVPAFNEEAYIEACIQGLLRQECCNIVEVIVADGGSTDGTIPIVEALKGQHQQVRLIHNPKRFQSAGVNLAAQSTTSRVFIRADAHMSYAKDYVKNCVDALYAHAATSVVVAMQTVGKTGFQRAVAAAQNSVLGNGGAAHRLKQSVSRFVEHGHHAAFDRTFFLQSGGYDENFLTCDDNEYDVRAGLNGARIWLAADAKCSYYPRAKPYALAKQYYRLGVWRVHLWAKHGLRPRLRQLLPTGLLFTIVCGFILSIWWWPFSLPPLAYFATCLGIGTIFAVKYGDPWLLAAGPAAVIMHISYGMGMLRTVLKQAALLLRRETNIDDLRPA